MFKIDLYEYETNKILGSYESECIPRVGEFVINDKIIQDDWKQKFWIVRSVTYTLGGGIGLHMQKYDIDEAVRKEKELKDKLKDMLIKAKKGE